MLAAFPAGVPSFGAAQIPQLFGSQAQCFFVDNTPSSKGGLGNDGNDGKSPSSPVFSIARGYQLLRDNFNDTLYVIGTGTAYTLSATLVWAKNYAHLVGITAPIPVSQRSRITSGAAIFTPLIQVTSTGCVFRNIQFVQFGSDAALSAVCFLQQGQRCYHGNCQFGGGGNATVRAGTAMRSLVVDGVGGNGEHMFDDCTIGYDIIDTAGVNYELDMKGNTPRNYFRNCRIIKRTVAGGEAGAFAIFEAAGIDRWTIFENLVMLNYTIGGGAALTIALDVVATDGNIILLNPLSQGATGLTGGTKTNVVSNPVVAVGTSGLSLEPST